MAAVMASTQGSTSDTGGRSQAPLRLRPSAARRRPVVAAVSLVVVLVSAAVVGSAFAAAGRTLPVLVVIRRVPVGAAITDADLGVASVHVPAGVDTVAAASEPAVLGRTAAERLLPGSLLTLGDVSVGSAIPPGDALVGVAVSDAQLPIGDLRPGGTVDVVATASPGTPTTLTPAIAGPPAGAASSASVGAVVVSHASVEQVTAGSASGSTSSTAVTILVPIAAAPIVAQLSAAGQAAIIAVPTDS